jgi:flagellar FliJ protein
MSKINGIQLAIEIAVQRRDACHKRLAMAERHQMAALGQMEQLQSYAGEKDIRLTSPAIGGLSGEILKHHYQFMGRLQEAIRMQSGVVLGASDQVRDMRLALMNAEVRLEGLKRIWKIRTEERVERSKRLEQKQTDEFASNQYARSVAQMRMENGV